MNHLRNKVSYITCVMLSSLLSAVLLVKFTVTIQHDFFFIDDAQDALLPAFRDIGRLYAQGDWPLLSRKMMWGGNYLVDMVYSPFNPIVVITGLAAYYTSSYIFAATLMATLTIGTGLVGAFAIARNAELSVPYASLFAFITVTTPVNYFISLQAWWNSAIAFSFFLMAVASVLLLARRTTVTTLVTAVVGACLFFTIAFAQAQLAYGIFVIILALILNLKQADWLKIVAVTTPLIAGVLIVWLPITLENIAETPNLLRTSKLANTGNFLKLSLDQVAFCYNPFYYTFMHWFGGYKYVTLPMVYVSIFSLAAFILLRDPLTFLRTNALWLVFAFVMILLASGPAQVGPLRFPLRLAPYIVLPIALVSCRALELDKWSKAPARWYVFFVVVGMSAWFQWSNAEARLLERQHLLQVLYFIASASIAVIWLVAIKSRLIKTAGILILTILLFILSSCAIKSLAPRFFHSRNMQTIANGMEDAESFALWLARSGEPATMPSLGHAQPLLYGFNTINGYSPVGHKGFAELFTFDIPSDTTHFNLNTTASLKRLATPIKEGSTKVLAQALGLSAIYAYRDQLTQDVLGRFNFEFHIVDESRLQLVIPQLPDRTGSISIQEPSIDARLTSRQAENHETYVVAASNQYRTLVFSRPFWLGYRISLNEKMLEPEPWSGGLLSVTLPPGPQAKLEVWYQPTTTPMAILSIIAGVVVTVVSCVFIVNIRKHGCPVK